MKRILPFLLALALLFASCASSDTKVTDETRIMSPEAIYPEDTDVSAIPVRPTDPPSETARISFLAAGDNVIHPCIYMDARARATSETRAYNFKPMYADVIDYIKGFDVAFINQETLMCGEGYEPSGYPNFNSPQELGLDLVEIGFDVIGVSNNHMLDKGSAGLKKTLDFYHSDEMSEALMIGGYYNKADFDNIRTLERNGITIAFLSYTYGTNGHVLPAGSELVVPYINDYDIIRQCAIAEQIGDITIVSIHWGDENSGVNDEQRRTAQLLADNGADVIIGHHPHVLQPIEIIESAHGETLCIYSLGNLLSAMAAWQNMVGGFLTFDIVAYSDGNATFDAPAFIPTAFYFGPSWYNSHLYFLKDYPADVAKTHGVANLYASRATPDDMLRYATKIMGDYLKLEP